MGGLECARCRLLGWSYATTSRVTPAKGIDITSPRYHAVSLSLVQKQVCEAGTWSSILAVWGTSRSLGLLMAFLLIDHNTHRYR